jgi:hypothetical protein
MTFDVEVVVRRTGEVSRETLYHDAAQPGTWTERDVVAVMTTMLLAVDRAANGGSPDGCSVSLRGLSWIVNPFDDGVALAIEIPSGSVVAGPFAMSERVLDGLVRRAIAAQPAHVPR